MHELARILHDIGGAAAAPEHAARLRALLAAELAHSAEELDRPRSGYDAPVLVAFAGHLALVPVDEALRADARRANDRGWLLTAAAVGALVEAGGAAPLRAGAWEGRLALVAPGADPELAALAFAEQVAGVDRLRAAGLALPPILEARDVRPPANSALSAAEAVSRGGGRAADPLAGDELPDVARPHDDPDPAMRAARRILQRLRGMGKWGGYHTAFDHLARGFPGHERALAFAVGEALLEAGLLAEKPSVGQRHVFLDPGRAGEIHALIDRGETPRTLRLP